MSYYSLTYPIYFYVELHDMQEKNHIVYIFDRYCNDDMSWILVGIVILHSIFTDKNTEMMM